MLISSRCYLVSHFHLAFQFRHLFPGSCSGSFQCAAGVPMTELDSGLGRAELVPLADWLPAGWGLSREWG